MREERLPGTALKGSGALHSGTPQSDETAKLLQSRAVFGPRVLSAVFPVKDRKHEPHGSLQHCQAVRTFTVCQSFLWPRALPDLLKVSWSHAITLD